MLVANATAPDVKTVFLMKARLFISIGIVAYTNFSSGLKVGINKSAFEIGCMNS